MIKILLVDDHEVVRKGIELLFKDEEIKVVGTAKNTEEALDMIAKKKPDVVLVDLRIGDEDGFETMGKIRKKNAYLPMVVFTGYDNIAYLGKANLMGAADYVLKDAPVETIVEAIRCAYSGDVRPRSPLRRVRIASSKKVILGDEEKPLTKRELEILKHVAKGYTNIEIGKSLKISVETVKEHVQNMLRKLRCSDRTEAAVWAVRNEIA